MRYIKATKLCGEMSVFFFFLINRGDVFTVSHLSVQSVMHTYTNYMNACIYFHSFRCTKYFYVYFYFSFLFSFVVFFFYNNLCCKSISILPENIFGIVYCNTESNQKLESHSFVSFYTNLADKADFDV